MPEIKEDKLNKIAGGTNNEVAFKFEKGKEVTIKKISDSGIPIRIESKINARGYEKQFHNIIYYHLAPIKEEDHKQYHGWYAENDIDGISGSEDWTAIKKPSHIVD